MTDFSFFAYSCREQRSYRLVSGHTIEIASMPASRAQLEIDSDDLGDFRVRGSHIFDSGNPTGLAKVEREFGVQLPEDIHDFYRRWNGGLLFLRCFYRLLNVEQIVEDTKDMRGRARGPVRVVRFCRWNASGCEFVLRKSGGDDWNVFMAEPIKLEDEILNDSYEDGGESGTVTDPSFSAWLRRLCDTDGWPPSSTWATEPDAVRLDC